MNETVAFIGAGFSAEAGVPTTRLLGESFLENESTAIDRAITTAIGQFWAYAFGIPLGARRAPTFEDHFTLIDIASNSGHNLGSRYTPAHLRALRRWSIHRAFSVLDSNFTSSQSISSFLSALARGLGNAIVSTNWDIVPEKHLAQVRYTYGRVVSGAPGEPGSLRLLKLHGSANWGYCDACRCVQPVGPGKGVLHRAVFLRRRDFDLFNEIEAGKQAELREGEHPKCDECLADLSARVATFSFAKGLEFIQFQSVWDEALSALRRAKRWIFIGYSLPEADFEIKHLLKTAQLARQDDPRIECVFRGHDGTKDKFVRFFGGALQESGLHADGFHQWWSRHAESSCAGE